MQGWNVGYVSQIAHTVNSESGRLGIMEENAQNKVANNNTDISLTCTNNVLGVVNNALVQQ